MRIFIVSLLAGLFFLQLPTLAAVPAPTDTVLRVEANPAKGFHYAYFLMVPKKAPRQQPLYLLVETNNTGKLNDTLAVHERAARIMAAGPGGALGRHLAKNLGVPLLVPAFPRPAEQGNTYTHALDKDVMHAGGTLKRLDLQLLRMIEDARTQLQPLGIALQPQVLLNGFSASGTFANRFTLLHPERVRAVAGGGLNGLLMLPVAKVQGAALPYPLGTADFKQLTGTRFNARAYRAVPQFLYMGALDDNDAAPFDDAYDNAERQLIYRYLGEKMQPDRWAFCQQVYTQEQAKATFKTYSHIGHGTDMVVFNDLLAFFKAHL
ncbi:hypothetical protein [Hymenobacter koreensis]